MQDRKKLHESVDRYLDFRESNKNMGISMGLILPNDCDGITMITFNEDHKTGELYIPKLILTKNGIIAR